MVIKTGLQCGEIKSFKGGFVTVTANNPHSNKNDEVEFDILRRARLTYKIRFASVRRIRFQQAFTVVGIVFSSLVIFFVSQFDLPKIIMGYCFERTTINFITVVVLVWSSMEALSNRSTNADRLNDSAQKISTLVDEFDTSNVVGVKKIDGKKSQFSRKYNELIRDCQANHSPIDYYKHSVDTSVGNAQILKKMKVTTLSKLILDFFYFLLVALLTPAGMILTLGLLLYLKGLGNSCL
jgi:conflict system pore-forming effector with SLATT domain